jgi:endonuclease/exonuclease/phosphatase family metal-dependent hydrolase
LLAALGLAAFLHGAGRCDELPPRLVVATWNVEWFYDDDAGDNYSALAKERSAPTRQAWQWKLEQVARVIAALRPDILALQEIENRRVLADLVTRLREHHDLSYRLAYSEGGDVFTEQDVALLYRSGLVSYGRREQTREMYTSNRYYNVQKHLFGEFVWQRDGRDYRLTVLTAHLRARSEHESIRSRQARLLHEWVGPRVAAGEHVIVLGDFNTEYYAGETRTDNDLGALTGLLTAATNDDLSNLMQRLPARTATHRMGRQYDQILVSPSLADGSGELSIVSLKCAADLVIRGRGPDESHYDDYYGIPDAERDVSDHYPVVVEIVTTRNP